MRSEKEIREYLGQYRRLAKISVNESSAASFREKAELLELILNDPKEEPPLTSQELRTLRDIIKNVGRNSNGSYAWLNEGY